MRLPATGSSALTWPGALLLILAAPPVSDLAPSSSSDMPEVGSISGYRSEPYPHRITARNWGFGTCVECSDAPGVNMLGLGCRVPDSVSGSVGELYEC